MNIVTVPLIRSVPMLVKHLLQAKLYPTAFICWLLLAFSRLVERKSERSLDANKYIMF